MTDVLGYLLLAAIPVVLVGLSAWHRSLLAILPAIIGIYAAFLASLFFLPFAGVAILWFVFSVAAMALQLWRFPGQYSFVQSLLSLILWPVFANFAAAAEKDDSFSVIPEEIPGQISGKVDFIETAGAEGNYIMVFLSEYGNTAFFCDGSLETRDGLQEDMTFNFQVDRINIEELGDDILWLTEPVRVTT